MPQNKSLARQVFPPGLVGDLMYKATQLIPMNAFAPRQMQPPMQGTPMGMPQAQVGAPQIPNPQMHMMPPNPGVMPQQMPQNQGPMNAGPMIHPPQMNQPGMMPPQQMPPAQNAFALRNVRY